MIGNSHDVGDQLALVFSFPFLALQPFASGSRIPMPKLMS
jgi:hypothetical protein